MKEPEMFSFSTKVVAWFFKLYKADLCTSLAMVPDGAQSPSSEPSFPDRRDQKYWAKTEGEKGA